MHRNDTKSDDAPAFSVGICRKGNEESVKSEEKIRTSVEIFGTTYKMIGTFDQTYMNKIAAYVNEKMESIAKSNPRLDSMRVAVMALITIADEVFSMKEEWLANEQEQSETKMRIDELKKTLELTEEKVRERSKEIFQLKEKVEKLEHENYRLRNESDMVSKAWSDQVDELKKKYAEKVRRSEEVEAALQARIAELERQLAEMEEAAAPVQETTDAGMKPEPETATAKDARRGPPEPLASLLAGVSADDGNLLEKFKQLQEEYVKLQKEFNEWIELTMSDTQ